MYISDAFNHHVIDYQDCVIDYQDCVIDYTVLDAQPKIAISRLGETTLAQARILQYSPGFYPPRLKFGVLHGCCFTFIFQDWEMKIRSPARGDIIVHHHVQHNYFKL
ncbi:hypothetical protein Lal_00032569 [Lupinus albus]|nr:hypothetical protein Lal_00032569 [Lupinus albus]